MDKNEEKFFLKNRYKADLNLVRSINERKTPRAIYELNLEMADEYYSGLFYTFTQKVKKFNYNIIPIDKEMRRKTDTYINKYKNTSYGRELILYMLMLKLAIETVLIYYNYDGTKKSDEEKSKYLKDLFTQTYIKDIVERNNIQRFDILDSMINMLASSVGSLTNPQKMYNAFLSTGEKKLSNVTVTTYLKNIEDAFIVNKSERYDVKGKKYISSPQKYYFSDIGLRNARLNFRQQEENHLMENIIYNELIVRGYNVDVGVV